jgi:methylase of polypeptide subunit release factors
MEIIDLIIETHVGLERQGPGSSEMTIKALSFLDDLNKISKVLDLGCGTGGQTWGLEKWLTKYSKIYNFKLKITYIMRGDM